MDTEENRIFAVYRRSAKSSSSMIDIGVNKGWHASRMIELCPAGHVYGVEASPLHVKDLHERFSSFENFTLVPRAVVPDGTNTSSVTFKFSDQYHGRGGIKGMHIWEFNDPGIDFVEVNVDTISFDELLAQVHGELAFVKMDIEGPEYSIIFRSKLFGRGTIRPTFALENSIHGLRIAGIEFGDFETKINDINYCLISTNGSIVRSELERRESGQTIFLAPFEETGNVSSLIVDFNLNNLS